MNWTEEKIKALSSEEYIKYRQKIREFYKPTYKKRKNFRKKTQAEIKEQARIYSRRSYQKSKIRKYQRQYRNNNKDKINLRAKLYRQKKYQADLNFKIMCNLRTRLFSALNGNIKSKSTITLLGCSIDYFREYLEKRFKQGMTWKNHDVDGWHIDHIKPCCRFDLSEPEEQKKCFHYTNLQPLWAKYNLRKNK